MLSYDLPLMSRLRERGVANARALVTLDRRDLADLVADVGPLPGALGDSADEQVARTVASITGLADATFPTEAIAHLASTSTDEALRATRDRLAQFFESEVSRDGRDGFDIRTSPVTAYLEEHGDRIFGDADAGERARVGAQLQRLQRVFRLGVDREQAESLLTLGLDSAFRITRLSPEHFTEEYGALLGGAEKAAETYGRAEFIAGSVVHLYTELADAVGGIKPMSLMSASGPEKLPELKQLAPYRALFGSTELCECGECQSVYSPAAYFIALLHMLDQAKPGAVKPVDVLLGRRPDLAHIQLTCENTNTLIPYVDLVTEVLESFVANRAPAPFNVPPGAPNQKLPAPSAEELRVNPVPLTAASATFADTAYARLQDAVFPLTLPLNLPLETTRAYLGHLGVSRAELMALFDRDSGVEAVRARAAEILLLSPEEFTLVTGARFDGASPPVTPADPELFGMTLSPPATAFNHAAPEFAVSATAPDQRSALIASLQNILGIIAPAPPRVTGRYDPPPVPAANEVTTEAAVNAVSTAHGLPATGRTDAAFWNALELDGISSLSAMLCPVPMLLERGGITYEELVALVKTRYVNPTLQGDGDYDYLARLGIPGADIRAWITAGLGAVPVPILGALTTAGEDPAAFAAWVSARTRAVVINTGFQAPCEIERATLLHLDGTLLSPAELVALFRFIRLWRKLGWTVADLDTVVEPGGLDGAPALATVLLLANVKQLREQLGAPIGELVTLWQTIPTHGPTPLYDALFRNRAAQLVDPVLALNRERTELAAAGSATPPALSDHIGALLAALRISALDLARVRTAMKLDDDPSLPPAAQPRLTLAVLSGMYRRVWLARTLELSVRDLLTLQDLSALPIFDTPDTGPREAALEFLDIVQAVRAAGVDVGMLAYICRAVPQPPGLPGAQRATWSGTLAALVDGLGAIAAEAPVRDDPDGAELTSRLTALLGPDDARVTTALVYGRDVYRAPLAGMPAALVFPAPLGARVTWDTTRKELRVRGALSTADQALLLTLVPSLPAAVQAAYTRAVKGVATQPRAFVARALAPLYHASDAEAALIDPPGFDAGGKPLPAVIEAKVADLLARRRDVSSRGFIKQTLATATGLGADVISVLLDDATVLTSDSGPGPAMPDYQALEGDGLDGEYFTNPDLTGVPALARTDAAVGFDLAGAPPAPGIPATGFSIRWSGSVYVPATGALAFHVRCTDGVRLTVDGVAVVDEWQDQMESVFNATMRLDGGRFYPVTLEYYNRNGDALLDVAWSSPSIPIAGVPGASLYTPARLDTLVRRIERMHKLSILLAPFAVSARDLQRLAARGDVSPSLMPVAGPVAPGVARAVFRDWLALSAYATLRDRYPSPALTMLDVASAESRAESLARFVTISAAAAGTLDALVDVFSPRVFDVVTSTWSPGALDLTSLGAWRTLSDAFGFVQRTGAAPAELLAWSRAREIDEQPAGPATGWYTWTLRDEVGGGRGAVNAGLAQAAKHVVRARYTESRWRTEARTINDGLRVRRREGLAASVLAMPEVAAAHVTTRDQLFEYLLIDVEMDPCAETSRIRQGIASVQLFVQRATLNLELLVPPSRIDRARWAWMKTYRVYEANLTVLLRAESYVQESLRDDKTPLYREFESELLQEALTEATAERAVRHYLEKLDDLAKLVVCGTCVDGEAGVMHVFGRTATAPYVFYHRRLDNPRNLAWTDGVWSAWQKLPVDVNTYDDGDNSGAHLVPVVWNRRVYLFWLNFEPKPQDRENALLPASFERVNCWHIKLSWSEYMDGQWSARVTGAPYLVSNSVVIIKKTPGSYPDTDSFRTPPFGPRVEVQPGFQVHNEGVLVDLGLIPEDYDVPEQRTYFPYTVTDADDRMLAGTVLSVEGDLAVHDHHVDTFNAASFTPKPSAHYLDASVDKGRFKLRVFARFKGTARGQGQKLITDTITIVQGGKRSDRVEKSTEEYRITDELPSTFRQVGTFDFPACAAELEADATTADFQFESLKRPDGTINSYMLLRDDWPGANGLRLTKGAAPILKKAPTPFSLIDSDNTTGFQPHVPFFYQDQTRCYLVTHESYAYLNENPAAYATLDRGQSLVERSVGLVAYADRTLSLASASPAASNPWTKEALTRWSSGPGVSAIKSGKLDLATLVGDRAFLEPAKAAFRLRPEYTFTPHWHPWTCPLISALAKGGLPGLYTPENEALTDAKLMIVGVIGGPITSFIANTFDATYAPDATQVVRPYPTEEVDFSRSGAYARYNWELFFHLPLTLADAFCRAGLHEEAIRCIEHVYSPTTSDASTDPSRVWRFLPLRAADTTRIEESVALLGYAGSDPAKLKLKATLTATIQDWLENPFNPHVIARRRPVVYQKYVFMKYLDCVIEWIDMLLRRDTGESIGEATQLLVLLVNLLGPSPQRVPMPGPVAPESFDTLRTRLDALGNAQVDLETRLPFTQLFGGGAGAIGTLSQLPQTLYFCLPQNDRLRKYWDVVADRLFKIRHCMNLDGTVRQVALFDEKIDPMLLVEATAHGVDIGSVLNDLYAPLPRYRFPFMLQQALALCGEVRSLGAMLLAIDEKRDAERLSALRVGHETQLLDQVRGNRRMQIEEAVQTVQALEVTKRMTSARHDYYDGLIAQGLISQETDQLGSLSASNQQQETASWLEATAHELNLIPNITTGTNGGSTFGGSNLGSAASAVARGFSGSSASNAYKANRASIMAGHTRRSEEWRFQREHAKRELDQVDRQLTAARIRRDLTQADLRNHETEIEQSRSVAEHLRTKFTNEQLYGVMEGQLRVVHYQCYQAAYEVAKAAQRVFRYAVGSEETFVSFGAWDSSVRGLLAGEHLYMQLKQMERAYVDHQAREFEIAKDVSLAQLDPLALIALKESGVCEFDVPEWLFDVDYIGHYFRRLKSVSLSIPGVVGRGASMNATLTLLNSKVRETSRVVGPYGDDANYRVDHLAVEAIAASGGQNDTGRFQTDGRDDKLFPFEGAGAISRWRLELPRHFRTVDYDTISDAFLHVRMTSRRDDTLAEPATRALEAQLDAATSGPLLHLFSLRHDFPNEWQTLRGAAHTTTVTLSKDRLPLLVQDSAVVATELHVALILKEPQPAVTFKATLTPAGGAPVNLQWPASPARYRSDAQEVTIPIVKAPAAAAWTFQVTAPVAGVSFDGVKDVLIAVRYRAKV